ncbi:MAG: ABC transporter substrate-binding protein [Nitrospirota bacterium]
MKHLRLQQITHSLLMVCMFIMVIGMPFNARAEQLSPVAVIDRFNATLLDVMKRADQLGYKGRYAVLEPVINDSFALSFMGAQTTGRFWKTMNEQQRNQFLKTYIDWTIATYAGRFDGYSGERFEPASESRAQGLVKVNSKLIQSTGEPPIAFTYIMRQIDEKWRVMDIQVSGVSQLALTRAQFTDVLKNKNLDALIAMLKEKTAGFAQPKK